jgi:hypothetical protein
MAISKTFYKRGKWAGLVFTVVALGLYIASYLHGFRWGESNDYSAIAYGQIGRYQEVAVIYAGEPERTTTQPVWEIPLGWCFLALAVATAWFWYQARSRVEGGHCRCCGYNLTGNISGICPACGTPAGSTESRGDQSRPPARDS